MKKRLFFGLFLSAVLMSATAENLPAFPGAEGGGKYVTGGRGGTVYYVNTLEDNSNGNSSTKEGSLRWCLSQSGTRTILFKVSGIIELTSRISLSNGNVTIAGQTAPGDGICLKDNNIVVSASNVIIRYIHFRPGDGNSSFEDDCVWGRYRSDIILDHCSMSWSVDECASFYSNKNFTMQWCLLAESLKNSNHVKKAHGYGGIWGGENATFHHNLLAHHDSRNPRFNGWKRSGLSYNTTIDEERVDYRNNVVYNWCGNSTYGGEAAGHYNMVNNYYKYGPATSSSKRYRLVQMDKDTSTTITPNHGMYYLSGNYIYGYPNVTADNTKGIQNNTGVAVSQCLVDEPFEFEAIPTHTAENAFEKVLAYVGASLVRDTLDARVTNEAKTGTATYKGSKSGVSGIIDTPTDVGGYPTYESTEAPTDTDRDGIPDSYEAQYGLDPMVYDSNKKNEEGYTYLEVYINGLVAHITEAEYEDVIVDAIDEVTLSNEPRMAVCNGRISVSSEIAMNRLIVYTIDGREMQSYSLENACQCAVDANLPQGMYLIRVQMTNGSVATLKVMM